MITSIQIDPQILIKDRFAEAGIDILGLERRDYPEESIFVVRVHEDDIENASQIGNEVDRDFAEHGIDGFVTVRQAKDSSIFVSKRVERGVQDPRAADLINLITAKSRTSEIQPSLNYIPDAANNVSRATAARHHLIFGRRGAGKTALMVEAKRIVELQGHLSV